MPLQSETGMLSVLALPGRRVVDLAAQLRGLLQQQVRRRAELLRERPQLLNVGARKLPATRHPQSFETAVPDAAGPRLVKPATRAMGLPIREQGH